MRQSLASLKIGLMGRRSTEAGTEPDKGVELESHTRNRHFENFLCHINTSETYPKYSGDLLKFLKRKASDMYSPKSLPGCDLGLGWIRAVLQL